MALRWGIAATGEQAHEFVVALRAFPRTEHIVVAVAARSIDRATQFAHKLEIPQAYEGYEKLGTNPNIDIVYVATLNNTHYEVSKMMLERNKHVLCEKPFTLNEKQTRSLIRIARQKSLFIMEGLWSRCFPAYKELKRIIDAGEIGEVMHVYSSIGAPIMELDKMRLKQLGGGALLTMGVYPIAFQQSMFRCMTPLKVVANGHLNDQGVDSATTSITTYFGNKMAVSTAQGLVMLSFEGAIYGTKGSIKVNFISAPTKLVVNGETKEFPLIKNPDAHLMNNQFFLGLAYEADEVRKCIKSGKIESPLMTHQDTIEVVCLMDKIRAEIGVVYEADSQNFD